MTSGITQLLTMMQRKFSTETDTGINYNSFQNSFIKKKRESPGLGDTKVSTKHVCRLHSITRP